MSSHPAARHLPLITAVIVLACAAIEHSPVLSALLRFEREALRRSEAWRFVTGHAVHGSPELLVLDLAVLFVLGAWWEFRSRAAFAAILVASAVAASIVVLEFTDFDVYVGSSALASGLFVGAALELALTRRGWIRFAGVLALLAFVAQCIAQTYGGLSWVTLPEGTSVAVVAHAAGAVAGAGVALARAATRFAPDRSRD